MNRTPSRAGFTLLEILVALLILSIMAGGFFYLTMANLNFSRQSDDRTRMVNYSLEVVEQLKLAWSDPDRFKNKSSFVAPTPPNSQYQLKLPLKVETLDPSGNVVTSGAYFTSPLLYRVTIEIKHTSPKGAVTTHQQTVRIGHPSPPPL